MFIAAMGIKKDGINYRLLHIVVAPDYEGKGIATELQHKALQFCKDEGALTIDVMKEEGGFFDSKKFGFSEKESYTIQGIKWVYYIWNKSKK
jgi:GNAT superfamily N-acetyltransferase